VYRTIIVAGVKVYRRPTWNFRSHVVSACISLWCHRPMHVPHRLMHALPHDVTGWCMQLLHWICYFDFVSDIPLSPATLLTIDKFGEMWCAFIWQWKNTFSTISLIIEGISEKVLQFIVWLRSTYIKKLVSFNKNVFWTPQKGSNRNCSMKWHHFVTKS